MAYAAHTSRRSTVSGELVCAICRDTYKSPRLLSCSHTFCEGCLQTLILQSVETGTVTSSITCPVCRGKTKPKDPTKPHRMWAQDLPTNYAIIPALEATSDESETRKCEPCARSNKSRAAVSYCVECGKYQCHECVESHSKFYVTDHHQFLSLKEASERGAGRLRIRLGKMEYCAEHDGEKIKFFCEDHSALCCSSCVVVRHRGCDHVADVRELGRSVIRDRQADTMKRSMTCLHDQLKRVVSGFESNITDIDSQAKMIPRRIKQIRDKVMKLFDNMIANVSSECTRNRSVHTNELKDKIDKCTSLSAELLDSCDVLNSAIDQGTESQVFIVLYKLQAEVIQYEKKVKEICDNASTVKLDVKLDEDLQRLWGKSKTLTKVNVTTTDMNIQFQSPESLPKVFWMSESESESEYEYEY